MFRKFNRLAYPGSTSFGSTHSPSVSTLHELQCFLVSAFYLETYLSFSLFTEVQGTFIFQLMVSVVGICFAAAWRGCAAVPCGKYQRTNLWNTFVFLLIKQWLKGTNVKGSYGFWDALAHSCCFVASPNLPRAGRVGRVHGIDCQTWNDAT